MRGMWGRGNGDEAKEWDEGKEWGWGGAQCFYIMLMMLFLLQLFTLNLSEHIHFETNAGVLEHNHD